MLIKVRQYRFLFEELVKRDFTKKYKRTVFGMLWSIMGPLMTLAVMALVFTKFFGSSIEHYVIYLFCGNLVYSYFREATSTGMTSLMDNAEIFSKVNVPKYMFLLSKNVSTLINFGLNILVLFIFIAIYQVPFSWKFIFLLYPICCLVVFNMGAGLILSALYLMFRDIKYLYDVFTLMLSAIIYKRKNYKFIYYI